MQVYIRRVGVDVTPSLARYHPEIKNPPDRLPEDKGCAELVSSQPQLLVTNVMTASAMLTTFSLHLAGALRYSELGFDVADALMRPVRLPSPPREDQL